LLNGVFKRKWGYYMPWFLVEGILIIISNAMLYTIKLDTSAGFIYGAEVLGGICTGLFVNALFSIAQWLVSPTEIPSAVGFMMCARIGGIVIALAMANTIFLNLAENSVSALLPNTPFSEVQEAISGVGSSLLARLDYDMKNKVLHANLSTRSARYSFWASLPVVRQLC
jgi:hypothetical protein